MTEEQLKTIRNFEVRVRQALLMCDKLKAENAGLQAQIEVQQNLNDSLEKEKRQLQTKYDNLQMARIISISRNDFKATKSRLSELVRDINKCINLLNE